MFTPRLDGPSSYGARIWGVGTATITGEDKRRKGGRQPLLSMNVPASRRDSGSKAAAPNQTLQKRVRTCGRSAEEAGSRPCCGLVLCNFLLHYDSPVERGSRLPLSEKEVLKRPFTPLRFHYAPASERSQDGFDGGMALDETGRLPSRALKNRLKSACPTGQRSRNRSEEHTSELQS